MLGAAAHHALLGHSHRVGKVPGLAPQGSSKTPVLAGKGVFGPWEPQTSEKSRTSPALGKGLGPLCWRCCEVFLPTR